MEILSDLLLVNTNDFLIKKRKKSIGKLSSGCRINSAADDSAGFTISERMRSQIRGLDQASRNAQTGTALIQTAAGALGEVNDILQRIHELSMQASNGTYTENDNKAIQGEINELVGEVDSISSSTNFNGIKLLDGTMAGPVSSNADLASTTENSMNLKEFLKNNSESLNIIYMKETDSFETTKTGIGSATTSGYSSLKNVLQTEIVPQAVKSVLKAFSPAFNYLSSSSIGIGLNLYSDTSTTVRASVTAGYMADMLSYQLSVNMASLAYDAGGNLTSPSRIALEDTIVHEMTHAFMDEALTKGMMGGTVANAFPCWFKEGMAQAAAGGYSNASDWVNSGLGITTSTSQTAIATKVRNSSNSLTSGTTASKYATGYLACMYLGYLASGSTNVTAADISLGLGRILSDMVNGKSMDSAINERTGGRYTSVSDFESKFGDGNSSSFIYKLTGVVGNIGNGGLATGDLTDSDLLPNVPATTSLFLLDTTNDTVLNYYPSDVNVLSGGGRSTSGTAPIGDYSSTIGGGGTDPINAGSTIDLSNISSITGISYDSGLNVLRITNSGSYTLTGLNTTGVRVVVDSGVNADITLNNAQINTANGAGISLEGNANVTLKLVGTNSVITSKAGSAGIRVTTGATLNIQGNGALDAESTAGSIHDGAGIGGGYGEDGGNIIINGGTITVKSKVTGAGIGGGASGNGGNITINGGNINVLAGDDGGSLPHSAGAGIGGGTSGNGGNITINGGSVYTISKGSAAGIGGGDYRAGGNITITGGTITAEGGEGAGIGGGGQGGAGGTITITGGTIAAKSRNAGAGIGGGELGQAGNITITGGTITAEGGSDFMRCGGAGIGAGTNSGGGSINIDGAGVIIKATGAGDAANIGGGSPGSSGGTPVSGGTVNKTTGIIFEGMNGAIYGNVTLGNPLGCDGKNLTVLGGSTLTVLNGGKVTNQGSFTNSGCIENHGVIGSVSGTGITHHYVYSISKSIKEPSTAIVGESLSKSISKLSPSEITVAYNGTTSTLTGTWSVADKDGKPITDLSRIVGDKESYKYTVTFTSQDGVYFDPLNMSIYQMKKYNTDSSKYQVEHNNYVSKSGPGGGGNTLTYSYIVNSALTDSETHQQTGETGGIKIQIGVKANQTITIAIESTKSKDLGIDNLSVLNHADAEKAMDASYKAINKVSRMCGNLGALQIRLEYATSNIDNMEEMLQDAESVIRDMDMAKGTTEYLKDQLLMQMTQAMIAQSNQSSKSILTLLS